MPILTTVFVTPGIVLLYGAKGANSGPLQVVNLSNSTTIYLATTSNPSPNQPGTFPLAPLASLAFDGSTAIYGTVASGNAIAGIVPGGEGYSPGALAITGPVTATISGPVSVIGTVAVSSVGGAVNVSGSTVDISSGTVNANVTNATIGVTGTVAVSSVGGAVDVSGSTVDISSGTVNATVTNATIDVTGQGGFILGGDIATLYSTTATFPINASSTFQPIILQDVTNYNSYDMMLSINDSSQALLGHAHAYGVTLTWYDDLVTGIPVFTETWWPWIGNAAAIMPVTATGPMHGKYMTVTVSNVNTANQIFVNELLIFGSGRTTNLSEWRQQANHKSDNSYTVLANNTVSTDNYIADSGGFVTVLANGNYVIFLGLYSGPVDWNLQIGGGGGLTRCNLIAIGPAAGQQTSGNFNPQKNVIEVLGTAVGTNNAGSQLFPRGGVALLIGVGAANTTILFTAVAQQGP